MGVTNSKWGEITLPANADLSAAQYKMVLVNSSSKAVLSTAVTDAVVGVLLNKPDAANKAARIQVAGIAEIVAGGTVTAGTQVTLHTTDGTIANNAADEDRIVGTALTTAAAGERAKVLLSFNAQRATA